MLKIKFNKYSAALSALCVILNCIAYPVYASGEIIAAAHYNNYPYEYMDKEGKPSGFTIELFRIIAERAGLEYKLVLLPPEGINEIIKSGDPDIIIGGINCDRYEKYIYAESALKILFSFAVSKDSPLNGYMDLAGGRIAVAGNEAFSVAISDIIRQLYNAETRYINKTETAISLLKGKGCDAVFMQETELNKIIDKSGDGSVSRIAVNPGAFGYGFFVRRGNSELLRKFRDGFSAVHSDGTYHRVYSRWFSSSENPGGRLNMNFVFAWFIVSGSVFFLFILINTFILKRRITEKTSVLKNTVDFMKKSEAELSAREKKLRKILDKLPAGILILDSAGRIVYFNESIKEIFGLTDPDEVYNLDVIESPNSTEWFKSRLKKYRSVSIDLKYDFELIRSTGFYKTSREGEITINASILPFSHDPEGNEMGYICYLTDVTESRNRLKGYIEAAHRYELIFDSIRDGLWEWVLDDDSIRLNRQMVNILGYRKELLPSSYGGICELIHPEDRSGVLSTVHEKVKSGRSFTVEYRILKNDGEWIWLRSRGEVIEWNYDLTPAIVIAVHTDITEVKQQKPGDSEEPSVIAPVDTRQTGISQPSFSLSGRKALIADDNHLISFHISDMLTRLGCCCVRAGNGIEAIEIVKREGGFDFILMDLDMPELDGMTAMELIREIHKDLPVIANTGHTDSGCRDELLTRGFNDVLCKPVNELKLIEKIEKILLLTPSQNKTD